MIKCIDEEIPFEIPDSWEWCRVSSLFQINPKVAAEDNDNAAFIPMEAISAGYGSKFRFYEKKWKEIKTGYTVFEDNDIAFAKITPCFQNRKSAIFKGLPNGIGAGTTELKILRTHGETINRFYVLYFLESPYFIDEATFKGTANQQRIIAGYLENKLFPLPPLAEQKRIVDKIDLVMPIIDKYSKSQETLNKMNAELHNSLKKSILQEAIQGKLVPQLLEEGIAKDLLDYIKKEKLELVKNGKLKKSALNDSVIFKGDDNKYYEQVGKNCIDITDKIPFEIPNNWVWTRLSDVADIYTGNSVSETEKNAKYTNVLGRNYIGTKDVGFDNKVFYNNGVAIPKEYEQNFRIALKDSILMCIEGGSAGRKVAILNQDVCFGNKLCCLSPFIEIGKYIYFYLQSPSFIDMFNQNKAGIIGGVSIAKVKDILIPLPPLKEQCRIIHRLEELYARL
ncbi:restriction endonuclease subunit S [Prevotella intermedia]|uniref:Restriction endonuclease subunit S n=1 Tax=Prevotella intermedia TaxID=28131 RepID=A0A2M8M4K8_PREIN|nr:restriction endonuclease subunit S [Prevotella intermedia]PJE99128.1 restriction endonuclease subunit S [Prevotella intermedia]